MKPAGQGIQKNTFTGAIMHQLDDKCVSDWVLQVHPPRPPVELPPSRRWTTTIPRALLRAGGTRRPIVRLLSYCSMELLRHGFFWRPFDFDLCVSNHRWFLLCKILKSLPYLICYKKDAVIDKGSAHRAFCVSFPRFGSSLRASRAFSTFAARSTCSCLFACLASVSLCFLADASVHGLHIVVWCQSGIVFKSI